MNPSVKSLLLIFNFLFCLADLGALAVACALTVFGIKRIEPFTVYRAQSSLPPVMNEAATLR
mgnify:CR=1 FL=1